ncbi:MAG: hypothetical protein OHM77_10975 [Candidatus Nitricoxidivorans perseverans]|uniref:Type 4 fimbrial biogenesis protein PilX N-terminal domain-containing protein n=1 Tax=Candidatus Nitricoxidivorans perseverans TaxID=2975601 RepID=A0AA49FK18_9PROT|nr:MAG: hypothetical protein OHM77_10975 [Candidatus Nitricoxidivorans perseverans]
MKPTPHGFAIVSAIFLLVILAALGAFMVTMSSTQHLTSAQDLQGSRAYRAARAGIEWAAAKLSADSSACPAASTTLDDGDGSPPVDLEDFTVVVTCAMNSHSEGSASPNIFWITSTASSGGAVGGIGYTERQLSAFIEF